MSALRRARVYRNVELAQVWLGLEPFDALSVITLGWFLQLLNRGALGWNLFFVALAYAFVRVAKRGKPEGYTRALVRFYTRRPFFSALAPDREAASHPFPRNLISDTPWPGGSRRPTAGGEPGGRPS